MYHFNILLVIHSSGLIFFVQQESVSLSLQLIELLTYKMIF